MAANNRVYYAIQQISMAPDSAAPDHQAHMKGAHGGQSV